MSRSTHEGCNVERFTKMLGIKQDVLAGDLVDDWNQGESSLSERKESIDTNLLQQISTELDLHSEPFQNFDRERAANLISCRFLVNEMFNNRIEIHDISPIDKIIELHEEKSPCTSACSTKSIIRWQGWTGLIRSKRTGRKLLFANN